MPKRLAELQLFSLLFCLSRSLAWIEIEALQLHQNHTDTAVGRDGEKLGLKEGRELGLSKGFEVGQEVGFYSGSVQASDFSLRHRSLCSKVFVLNTVDLHVQCWRLAHQKQPELFPARSERAIASLEDLLKDFPQHPQVQQRSPADTCQPMHHASSKCISFVG